MLRRLLETAVFQQAVQAVFEDLDLTEAAMINRNPDASPNLELRLQNNRKGHNDFLFALKMMCEPHEKAPEMPEETYGAEQQKDGWLPAEQLIPTL